MPVQVAHLYLSATTWVSVSCLWILRLPSVTALRQHSRRR